jgi:hypothetical protein
METTQYSYLASQKEDPPKQAETSQPVKKKEEDNTHEIFFKDSNDSLNVADTTPHSPIEGPTS